MADIHRIGLDEVARHFEELEDPRSTINRRHPLVSVVVIALMAVLAGASGPTAIAKWAALKEEFLLETLDLPNGIPCKDVFRRVLVLLKPTAFQACFANWLQSLEAVEKLICLVFLVFRIMKDKSITSRFQPAQHQLNATDHEHAFTCLR